MAPSLSPFGRLGGEGSDLKIWRMERYALRLMDGVPEPYPVKSRCQVAQADGKFQQRAFHWVFATEKR